MSQQLERLLPVLAAIPGVNIPAAFLQSAYIAASQKKIEQLEQALRYEIGLLNQKITAGQLHLDHDYVRSDAFAANVIQALRAAEIADSEEKLKYIAKALAGCAAVYADRTINRPILMRIIEQITIEEIDFLAEVIKEERFSRNYVSVNNGRGFLENEETGNITRGLFQLGLLEIGTMRLGASPTLVPSILAEHIGLLCGGTLDMP